MVWKVLQVREFDLSLQGTVDFEAGLGESPFAPVMMGKSKNLWVTSLFAWSIEK